MMTSSPAPLVKQSRRQSSHWGRLVSHDPGATSLQPGDLTFLSRLMNTSDDKTFE